MTAPTSVGEMSLANKCMDFCQALASQGTTFSFILTTGSQFSFSLETRGMKTVEAKKKKLSPSDVRRNERRRQEFLRRKPAAVSASPTTTSSTSPAAVLVASEVPQVPPRTCKRWNLPCQGHPAPGYGMGRCQVNLGASGQSVSTPSTPENLRGSNGARSSLASSPLLTSREESCGGPSSPSHQCEEEDEDKVATEGKHCGVRCCCHCDHEPECKCWTVGPYCGFDICKIQEHIQETGSCEKM